MGAGVADSGRGRALGGRVRARRGGGRTRRPVGPGLRRLRRHPAPTPTGGGHRVRHAGGRGARQREGEHHNRRSGRACRTPSAGALPAPQGNPMPAPPLVPGSVTAPGERAVVLGDGTEGDIDTGDQPGGTQAMTGRRRRKTYPLQSAEATELPPHATVASGDRSIAIDTWGRPFNGIANTGDDAAFVGRAQELTLLDTAPGERAPRWCTASDVPARAPWPRTGQPPAPTRTTRPGGSTPKRLRRGERGPGQRPTDDPRSTTAPEAHRTRHSVARHPHRLAPDPRRRRQPRPHRPAARPRCQRPEPHGQPPLPRLARQRRHGRPRPSSPSKSPSPSSGEGLSGQVR